MNSLLPIVVLCLCAFALVWEVVYQALRLRTWSGYWEILPRVKTLPLRWRKSARRDKGDLVLRGKHQGKRIVIRFSQSDFRPGLHLTMEVPVQLTLAVLPRRAASCNESCVMFRVGDPFLDETYVFHCEDKETVLRFRLTNSAEELRALCKTGTAFLSVGEGGIELGLPLAPDNLSTEITGFLDAMARLAARIAELPQEKSRCLVPDRPRPLAWTTKAAIAIAVSCVVIIFAGFPEQLQDLQAASAITVADGSAIDYRDGVLIPKVQNWRLANAADFPGGPPHSGEGPLFPLRLHPSSLPEDSESVYVLQGADDSKRICVLLNGKLVYDARYEKLAAIGRVTSEELKNVNWDGASSEAGLPYNADGLLVVVDPQDAKGAFILVANNGRLESFAPPDYREVRMIGW